MITLYASPMFTDCPYYDSEKLKILLNTTCKGSLHLLISNDIDCMFSFAVRVVIENNELVAEVNVHMQRRFSLTG
jgi:hypothetical protein